MGWINILSFTLWIYGEEIFKRDLKQKKKATANMALFKIIAETFLWAKDGVRNFTWKTVYFIEIAKKIPLLLYSKGLMASWNMFFIEDYERKKDL